VNTRSVTAARHILARWRGFTLIELLVALFITAVLFAMGYGAVNQAVNSRKGLEEQQARLLAVQTTMRLFAQDFGQLAPRPVRQPVGSGHLPDLVAASNTQPFVTLTRGGWANPAGLQRPALQRVAYFLEKGTLRREYWPVLDAMLATPTKRRELLTGVKSVIVRYMDGTGTWGPQWPPNGASAGFERLRPIAVEVTLELEDWGHLVRIFEVPA
jgi:general secretion pathway protein J